MEDATPEQLVEYETQLAGIEELLAASPGDESLLGLKADLEPLLTTRQTLISPSWIAPVEPVGALLEDHTLAEADQEKVDAFTHQGAFVHMLFKLKGLPDYSRHLDRLNRIEGARFGDTTFQT